MGEPTTYQGFHEGFHIEVVDLGLQVEDPAHKTHPAPDITPMLWSLLTAAELLTIREVHTGLLLFNAIRNAGGDWVRIIPRYPYVGYARDCNADSADDSGYLTAGGRAKAWVRFSPHRFRQGGFCDRKDNSNRGFLPQEILFHELVHAMRYVTKKRHKEPVHGGLFKYDNTEEFYAVLLTNIFISDPTNQTKSGLRQDHQSHLPLDQQLATSFEFFRSSPQVYPLVARFFRDHPQFAHEIACSSNATFNPLKAYDSNPAKAKAMSNSAFANVRGAVGTVIEASDPEQLKSRFVDPLLTLLGHS
jgi:hypothetical protein